MADPKDDKDKKVDPRTASFIHPEPRSQAEIVAEAYDHEDPTPTQMENDAAKVAAMHGGSTPEGGGDPQAAEAKRKKELEANRPGGYQTRGAEAAQRPAEPKKD